MHIYLLLNVPIKEDTNVKKPWRKLLTCLGNIQQAPEKIIP